MPMSLLKYFKRNNELPNPTGPLSTAVTPSGIATANRKIEVLMRGESGSTQQRKRGRYNRSDVDIRNYVAS